MGPMQQQSSEIHTLVSAAIETSEEKAEPALDALIGDPGDVLSDDFLLKGAANQVPAKFAS